MTDSRAAQPTPPPDWYPDPEGRAAWRWYDGTQWTQVLSSDPPPTAYKTPKFFVPWPHNRPQWFVFCLSALVGLAVWIPTMAAEPLYSDGPHEQNGSPWFFPLTLLAAIALGALFSRNWQVVAPGIMTAQFLMAPWTTPRGDGDGLWVLIFFGLAMLAVVEHVAAASSGTAVAWLRGRLRNSPTSG